MCIRDSLINLPVFILVNNQLPVNMFAQLVEKNVSNISIHMIQFSCKDKNTVPVGSPGAAEDICETAVSNLPP